MIDLFVAILNRWEQKSLDQVVPGGLTKQEPPERTQRPYAVMKPLAEVDGTRTNKGKYIMATFTINVTGAINAYWEDLEDPVNQIVAAMEAAPPLVIPDSPRRTLVVRRADLVHIDEDQYSRAVITFRARLGAPFNPNQS